MKLVPRINPCQSDFGSIGKPHQHQGHSTTPKKARSDHISASDRRLEERMQIHVMIQLD
jgi:hypothetical protein